MAKQVIVYNGQIQANNGNALNLQNLQPENIKSGVTIGGVTGIVEGASNLVYFSASDGSANLEFDDKVTVYIAHKMIIKNCMNKPKFISIRNRWNNNSPAYAIKYAWFDVDNINSNSTQAINKNQEFIPWTDYSYSYDSINHTFTISITRDDNSFGFPYTYSHSVYYI